MLTIFAAVLLVHNQDWDRESVIALNRLKPVFVRASRARTLHCLQRNTVKGTSHEYWIRKPNLFKRRDLTNGSEVVSGPGGNFKRNKSEEWSATNEKIYFFVEGLGPVFKEFFNIEPYGMQPAALRTTLKWNGRPRKVIEWTFASGEPTINLDTAYFDARTLRLLAVEERNFMYLDIPEGELVGRHVYPVLRWNERLPDSIFGPAAKTRISY